MGISYARAQTACVVQTSIVTNNIFFNGTITRWRSPALGICMERDAYFRGALQNNVFADCAAAAARTFTNGSGTCPGDTNHSNCIAPSGTLNDAVAMGGTLGSDNVNAGTAAALFISAPSDLHLSASSPAKSAGLDASQAICGVDGITTCGDISGDFTGAQRTPPYSSGVFELN